MKITEKITAAVKRDKKILIATHINPDGDALGSALSLSTALNSTGKKTFIYCRDRVPKSYRFLPGHRNIISNIQEALKGDPLLILLDCNSPERAGLEKFRFRYSIVIDHHETENNFGDLRWVDPKAAATGMMVFALIKDIGVKITRDIAINLYTAITADTGTFRYSNTYPEVLKTGAELVKAGAEPDFIASRLYETWDKKRFDLLISALNTLVIKDGIAIMYISREMFRKTGTKYDDTEHFSNFPRMVGSVKVSAVFKETGNGLWKVSLRSKSSINVAKIAEQYEGGGHRNAAGFRIKADLETARKKLIQAVKKLGSK
jgi:bifunctional oligoribonuclease and PAP phosphatase NrnA